MQESEQIHADSQTFSEIFAQNTKGFVQEKYYYDWIVNHKNIISELKSAAVIVRNEADLIVVATYQQNNDSFKLLLNLIDEQLQSKQPLVSSIASTTGKEEFALLYPLFDNNDQLIAYVGMVIAVETESQLQDALRILQLSISGLEVVEYQKRLIQNTNKTQKIDEHLNILAVVLAEPTYKEASVRLVTELAVLFNCDRVTFGHYRNQKSKVKYISHSTEFSKRVNLIRCIEQAMDECIDQKETMFYSNSSTNIDNTSSINLCHQTLIEIGGCNAVLSIPVYYQDKIMGAFVLEFNQLSNISEQQIDICESIISLMTPVLEDKRLNDKNILLKNLDFVAIQLKRLFGPNYLGRKLFLLCCIAIGAFFSTVEKEYKLVSSASVENAITRSIVAPFNGYIEDVAMRAGDKILKNDLLVTMDNKDLRLEQLKWLSEEAKLRRQYQEALAVRERAKINIINAKLGQIKAQLDLVKNKLQRSELRAPFNGIVVKGDLSQRLGSAIETGEKLLEVAPRDSYRIKMLIPENRINEVKLDQVGQLYLAALPNITFDFKVSKITPVVEVEDGSTFFIVESEFLSNIDKLQPGLEGIAKINIDKRLLISIWTRDIIEWFRLQLWSFWG